MSETNKNLIKYNARVTMKHDTSAHWEQAENFIPLAGEIIVYDDLRKFKIGDGTTKVNNLPFSSAIGYNANGQNYPVQEDNEGKMFVNVPWTDNNDNTTYSAGSGISISGNNNAISVKTGYVNSPHSQSYAVRADEKGDLYTAVPWIDTTYNAGDGLKLAGTKFTVDYGEGLMIDEINKHLELNPAYTAIYYDPALDDNGHSVITGRTGLMTPDQAYDLARATMLFNNAIDYGSANKPMGFYKFSTTSYGFVQKVEPVTAEDIEGMEINTETSGASNTNKQIFLLGAETQGTTAKTFTNKKAYIDKDGYIYSNDERTLTSSDLFDSFTNTIKSTLLPSYVDDIIEGYYMPFETTGAFIGTDRTTNIPGEVGKIYVDLDTNKTYRWSGNGASSRFVEISSGPLSLGTSETSAFYGNLGQIAYEHALHGEACDDKATLDLYKIKTENGHVVGTEKVTKSDILGYKAYTGSDTIVVTNGVISLNTGYYATAERSGIMQASDFAHLWSIEANANNYVLPMATSSALGGIKVGANLTMGLDGTLSAAFPNANYETDGLMTAEYYSRLVNHTHTITYTPEATVSFSGTKGNTTAGSTSQVIMAILDSTATATVSSSYYNKNLTLTPAALSELGVALANHIHEFTPAGTVNYQGTQAKLTTGAGIV